MAFFSRLEERKGIKWFVDALHKLDYASIALNQVVLPMPTSKPPCRSYPLLLSRWRPYLIGTEPQLLSIVLFTAPSDAAIELVLLKREEWAPMTRHCHCRMQTARCGGVTRMAMAP